MPEISMILILVAIALLIVLEIASDREMDPDDHPSLDELDIDPSWDNDRYRRILGWFEKDKNDR